MTAWGDDRTLGQACLVPTALQHPRSRRLVHAVRGAMHVVLSMLVPCHVGRYARPAGGGGDDGDDEPPPLHLALVDDRGSDDDELPNLVQPSDPQLSFTVGAHAVSEFGHGKSPRNGCFGAF